MTRHPTRRTICLIAGVVIIALAVVATAIPTTGVLGLDPAGVAAIEVAIASALATFLFWYGLSAK